MIIDSIENAEKYYGLSKDLEGVFSKLKELMMQSPEDAKYSIGEKSTVSVENDLKLRDRNCLYEYHRKFIDIHLCLKNEEIIEFSYQNSALTVSEEEKDFYLVKGDYSGEVVLTEGMFAMFFTSELHKPLLGNPENVVSKCVAKVYAPE